MSRFSLEENQKILVTQSSLPPIEEYIEKIREIWDTKWLTNAGVMHNELQKELENYLGVENLALFVNGHQALELALQALEMEGEVITTPFTFVSTTHAIVRNGLKPVFCDINTRDYTIDVDKLENLITDKTVAIVPVHVYGNICDVERIDEIAKKYNLKVIYDAAHAFGVKYKGHGVAEFGDMSMFSFHATKVFNTIEGGAICFKDKELESKITGLRNFGIRNEECIDLVGSNAKMNEFQAAMGLCNLKHIEEEIQKRKSIVETYRECLANSEVVILEEQENVTSNYAYFPVLLESNQKRDELYTYLKEKNIYTRKYFYPLTNDIECYKDYDCNDTPVAKNVASRVLTIPLYADLDKDVAIMICKEINNFLNSKNE